MCPSNHEYYYVRTKFNYAPIYVVVPLPSCSLVSTLWHERAQIINYLYHQVSCFFHLLLLHTYNALSRDSLNCVYPGQYTNTLACNIDTDYLRQELIWHVHM